MKFLIYHCNSICHTREYLTTYSRAQKNNLWAPVLTYILKCASIIVGWFNLEFSHVSMTSSLIFCSTLLVSNSKFRTRAADQIYIYIQSPSHFSSELLDLRSLSRRAMNLKNPPTSPLKAYFWANLPSIIS